jgi:hypothetical protein
MYSIGKDSSVLLHLARKAFFPGRIPFPLLHIDTGWKFKEMISFRDETAKRLNAELIVHTNEAGRAAGVTPFTHGARYTDIMKTEALKAALDKYGAMPPSAARAATKRNPAPRSACSRFRDRAASLGSEEPAPRALEPLQRPAAPRRQHPRVPAQQLDRGRHLDVHPHREHPGGAVVLRQASPGR